MLRASLLVLAGCGFAPVPVSTAGPDALIADAAADAPVPLGPWGTPTPVVLGAFGVDDPSLTGDLLELYFNANGDIYVAQRAAAGDAWGTPALLPTLSVASETTPEVSYDGLELMFASTRYDPQASGDDDIWISTRPDRQSAWGTPVIVPELDGPTQEAGPVATPDGRTIVFSSYRTNNGSPDLFLATRATTAQVWGSITELVALNTTAHEGSAFITGDGLTIYFDSDRTGPGGPLDLYTSHRDTVNDAFPTPQPLADIDTAADEEDPWVSPDQRHLFFYSDRGGMPGLWESTR